MKESEVTELSHKTHKLSGSRGRLSLSFFYCSSFSPFTSLPPHPHQAALLNDGIALILLIGSLPSEFERSRAAHVGKTNA